MTKSKSTPVSVRCARWAAVAAAITAIGSCFNTVWTERPWWKDESPRAVMTQSVSNERLAPPSPMPSTVQPEVDITTTVSPDDVGELITTQNVIYLVIVIGFIGFLCFEIPYRFSRKDWSIKSFWDN